MKEQTDRPDGVTIVIVEDHQPTLLAVRQIVSAAFPGCKVLGAGSAEQAIELCGHHAPHVIVMDIALPGIDGIEATRRIRALQPDVRVVMHSSHDIAIYRDASAAAGAAAFVAKSSTSDDLVPAIAGLLPPGLRR